MTAEGEHFDNSLRVCPCVWNIRYTGYNLVSTFVYLQPGLRLLSLSLSLIQQSACAWQHAFNLSSFPLDLPFPHCVPPLSLFLSCPLQQNDKSQDNWWRRIREEQELLPGDRRASARRDQWEERWGCSLSLQRKPTHVHTLIPSLLPIVVEITYRPNCTILCPLAGPPSMCVYVWVSVYHACIIPTPRLLSCFCRKTLTVRVLDREEYNKQCSFYVELQTPLWRRRGWTEYRGFALALSQFLLHFNLSVRESDPLFLSLLMSMCCLTDLKMFLWFRWCSYL